MLKALTDKYDADYAATTKKCDAIEARIEKARKTIARAEAQRRKLQRPSWVDVVRTIAGLIGEHLPDRNVEVLGPFGLGATVAIHCIRKDATSANWSQGDNCWHMSLRPDLREEMRLGLVDYTTNTECYPPGSVGDRNELNHPTIPVPEDADVNWFIEHMTKN